MKRGPGAKQAPDHHQLPRCVDCYPWYPSQNQIVLEILREVLTWMRMISVGLSLVLGIGWNLGGFYFRNKRRVRTSLSDIEVIVIPWRKLLAVWQSKSTRPGLARYRLFQGPNDFEPMKHKTPDICALRGVWSSLCEIFSPIFVLENCIWGLGFYENYMLNNICYMPQIKKWPKKYNKDQ